MPTHTKTNFPLYGYEQYWCQSVLPTFEDVVKSYPQYSTKEERGDQQPSIAEKLIAELVAPQLEQLWH